MYILYCINYTYNNVYIDYIIVYIYNVYVPYC